MKRRRGIYLILAAVLLCACFPVQDRIGELKDDAGLIETDVLETMTPGELWGTLLIGGFRGIAVDILWVRAMNLQQEKKFFELITLFDMILTLQPNFLNVWAYSAWNFSYNISHEYEDLPAKWNYVQKGIETLEEGIKRNPKPYFLYFQLGWIYFHKCDAEDYYKEQLRNRGENNWLLAVKWFDKAIEKGDTPVYMVRMRVHAYEKLYQEKLERRDTGDIEALGRKIVDEWKAVLDKHPKDQIARDAYDAWAARMGMIGEGGVQ